MDLKKTAALVILATLAACGGGDPPPPPAQDTTLSDAQREALEQRVAELEKQVSQQAGQPATPSASKALNDGWSAQQSAARRNCIVEVAGKYCLGGSVETLPPNPNKVANGTHTYDDGVATSREGEIVLVGLDLGEKSWSEFIALERTLTDTHGPPDFEGTTVPISATDAEAQVLVKSGQAVYARTWLATDYSIRLWADATYTWQQFFLFGALDLLDAPDTAPDQFAQEAEKEQPSAVPGSAELLEVLSNLQQVTSKKPAQGPPLSVTTSARVVKRSSSFCTWAWKANIINLTQVDQRFYLKVDFVDGEGYSLDYVTKSVAIGPEGSKRLTGQAVIKLSTCRRVVNTQPQVEFY